MTLWDKLRHRNWVWKRVGNQNLSFEVPGILDSEGNWHPINPLPEGCKVEN